MYLPTDPQTQNYNAEELLIVLGEIENVMDTAEYDDCIVQGDLNWDSVRRSGFFRPRLLLPRPRFGQIALVLLSGVAKVMLVLPLVLPMV